MSDSDDSDDFPYVDDHEYGLLPFEEEAVEEMTLHELLTLLDGKQQ